MRSDLYTLQRELDFLENSVISFRKLIKSLHEEHQDGDDKEIVEHLSSLSLSRTLTPSLHETENIESKEDEDIDIEFIELQKRLDSAKLIKKECQDRRKVLAMDLDYRFLLEDAMLKRVNQLSSTYSSLLECSSSIKKETDIVNDKLQTLVQYNVINDAFHVWYSGPFGTINNFRLGTLPASPVDWTEINAAFGQAVLAISVIAKRADIEFTKYGLIPLGSFPKVYKVDDRRTTYCLFTDGSFSLFPKRKFNLALFGFLHCVEELGEYVTMSDPTLTLPYLIQPEEGKINNQLVTIGIDDEVWTRSLKFLLADVKWIIAWASKHCFH